MRFQAADHRACVLSSMRVTEKTAADGTAQVRSRHSHDSLCISILRKDDKKMTAIVAVVGCNECGGGGAGGVADKMLSKTG